MKIAKKIITGDGILGHLVIHCMVNTPELKGAVKPTDEFVDVVLTINGVEANLQSFLDHWQKQVRRMIRGEAEDLFKEYLGDRLYPLTELITDLEDRLIEEWKPLLSDWEKGEFEKDGTQHLCVKEDD